MRLPSWKQKCIIWDAVGYSPNEMQAAFHRSQSRRVLVAGGERAGKSFSVAKEMLTRVPFGSLFWILGPDYEQARAEFQYLLDDLVRLGAISNAHRNVSQPRVGPWWMKTKSGQVIETKSAKHEERIASKAPDGIVMAEAAQQSYAAYLKTYGRLSQEKGWLLAVGTFEGSLGWYPDVFSRWQGANAEDGVSFSLPTWSNLARYPGGRTDPEIKTLESLYPADLFQERFGAVPCKPQGLVFREFDFATHVQSLSLAEGLPVELAIDPGYAGGYAVLAIQQAGPYVHVIDEIYERGLVAQEVIAACKKRPWWKQVRKRSSGQSGGVIDVAGTQHQGLDSHVEVWASDGDVGLRYQPVGIEQGIQALRVLLKDPGTGHARIFFQATMRSDRDGQGLANGTLAEMGLYRYKQAMDGQPVSETPIDSNNHGLKALGYWAYDRFGPVGGRTPPPAQVRRKGFGSV